MEMVKYSLMKTPQKIETGFWIDEPNIFVPWNISEQELETLLGKQGLKRVTDGYYTIACTTPGGQKHLLGFHFRPQKGGRLRELEFFRDAYADLKKSYEDFQKHFEGEFGPPNSAEKSEDSFDRYVWRLGKIKIEHYVLDRFGPEEHMRIRFTGTSP